MNTSTTKKRRRGWGFVWRTLLYGSPADRRLLRYYVGEQLARVVGDCWVPEDQKLWMKDESFWQAYRRLEPRNRRSAERKYAVRELVRSLGDLPGDTAECGVFTGATSYFILEQRPAGPHHLFDSFSGLSPPQAEDAVVAADISRWQAGDLTSPLEILRANLAPFPSALIYPGWIPSRFHEVAERSFCFVHIDVDLYQPTRDSLEFFYPRLVPGGMLVCDDYGYLNCPGAKQACDELAQRVRENWIALPTGQALMIKRAAAEHQHE